MQSAHDVVDDLRKKLEQEMLAYTQRSELHRGKARKIMVVDKNKNEGIFSLGEQVSPFRFVMPGLLKFLDIRLCIIMKSSTRFIGYLIWCLGRGAMRDAPHFAYAFGGCGRCAIFTECSVTKLSTALLISNRFDRLWSWLKSSWIAQDCTIISILFTFVIAFTHETFFYRVGLSHRISSAFV